MQICWIWEKVISQNDRGFQQFLDNAQYKLNGILRYERVFGEGFVSTGGIGMPIGLKRYLKFLVLKNRYGTWKNDERK